jgi:cytidylate kinase
LAVIGRDIGGVLQVQTFAPEPVRCVWCQRREGLGKDWDRAVDLIQRRDKADSELALQLYDCADFSSPHLYDLICRNEGPSDIGTGINAVCRMVAQ